jgi:hypothetical protein
MLRLTLSNQAEEAECFDLLELILVLQLGNQAEGAEEEKV